MSADATSPNTDYRALATRIVDRFQLTHDAQHAWWHTTLPPGDLVSIIAWELAHNDGSGA